MQWDHSPNGGFTQAEVRPWLPLGADYPDVNVVAQRDQPRSMLTLYRKLIALRRAEPALAIGEYQQGCSEGDVFAFVRRDSAIGRQFLVALNFSPEPRALRLKDCKPAVRGARRIILSTHLDQNPSLYGDVLDLRPDEGVIVRLDDA